MHLSSISAHTECFNQCMKINGCRRRLNETVMCPQNAHDEGAYCDGTYDCTHKPLLCACTAGVALCLKNGFKVATGGRRLYSCYTEIRTCMHYYGNNTQSYDNCVK